VFQARVLDLAALRIPYPARTFIFATLSEFLVFPAHCRFRYFFPLLLVPHLHDLVLPVATTIHSRADHCITE